MWERFTERARRAVYQAQQEAQRFDNEYVSTEHLLLGLLHESDNIACQVLMQAGISSDALRQKVEQRMAPGNAPADHEFKLSPRGKRIIDLAFDEAQQLANSYLGTEHLLLGLIRERKGLAGRMLAASGAELEAMRGAVSRFWIEGGQAEVSCPSTRPNRELTPVSHAAQESISSLLKVLHEEGQRRQPSISAGTAMLIGGVLIPLGFLGAVSAFVQSEWTYVMWFLLLLVVGIGVCRSTASDPQIQAAWKLTHYDDKRLVPWFIYFLTWPERQIRREAIHALTRLLPSLQASDAGLLDAPSRARLYQELNLRDANERCDFLVAILKALEQVGDAEAMSHVHSLARGFARTANEKRVQEAALNCLPYLQARAEGRYARETLLRIPAEVAPAEDLLRPAAATAENNDPESLLRPGAPEEEATS